MKLYYDVERTAGGPFMMLGRDADGPFTMLGRDALKTAGFEAGDKLEINIEEGGNRIIITKAKQTFNAHKWARSIHKKYSADYYWEEVGGHRCVAYEKVAPLGRMSKFGFAQCHPDDMYDEYVGGAIAICRAEGIPLPNELTSGKVMPKRYE